MIKNKTARNKFQGGELTTVRTQSALFVIPLKICLYRQLPLRGVAVVLKEPLHSAPGLPDAGLILKKLPPVGKSFLLTNTPFVLLIYLDLKQNSPWCKTKVREFTTDHRTVRVIRAHNLISPAPSLQESFFFLWKEPLHSAPGLPDAGLILKKTQPVGKSFLLTNTPFVLLIYLDLKQNSPWCKTKVTGLLSKNNRCSGCFCLQNLCNILMSKESVSNRGEFRCLSEENWSQNSPGYSCS